MLQFLCIKYVIPYLIIKTLYFLTFFSQKDMCGNDKYVYIFMGYTSKTIQSYVVD